jgi:hypothetical protein
MIILLICLLICLYIIFLYISRYKVINKVINKAPNKAPNKISNKIPDSTTTDNFVGFDSTTMKYKTIDFNSDGDLYITKKIGNNEIQFVVFTKKLVTDNFDDSIDPNFLKKTNGDSYYKVQQNTINNYIKDGRSFYIESTVGSPYEDITNEINAGFKNE